MNKRIVVLGSVIAIATAFAAAMAAFGDDEHRASSGARYSGVAPVKDKQYQQDCGTCHLAYPPGLLPARSWERIVATLDNHFGENAELSADDSARLRQYLIQNAADQAPYKKSQRIVASLRGETPLRITDVPYIKGKHRKLPRAAIGATAQVKSLSDCAACHGQAAAGVFHEHDVVIPGLGPWRD